MRTLPSFQPDPEADLVILNLGAGRQSAALALMACEGLIPKPDAMILANTGWERKQTLRYLEQVLVPAAERAGIPIYVVAAERWASKRGKFTGQLRRSGLGIRDDILRSVREGTPIANPPLRADKGDGRSGPLKRLCTGEYKIAPITKKIRELLGLRPRQVAVGKYRVEQWIGIATEERQRAKGESGLGWATLRYPLLEMDLSTEDCIEIIEELGYPVPVKSACVGCPYRSDASWARLKHTDPDAWADAVDFDRKLREPDGRGRIKGARFPAYLHASCRPLEEIELPRELMDDTTELFGGEFC